MYAAGGTIDLHHVTVSGNTAASGAGGEEGNARTQFKLWDGWAGKGKGGGLYIDAAAAVCLDPFTQDHVHNNNASTKHPNIRGPYTTCS